MRSLERWDYPAAANHFQRVSDASSDDEYAALAQFGLAIIRLEKAESDLLARIAVERDLFRHREARADWSGDVLRLVPELICRSSSDTDWIDSIETITSLPKLVEWGAGPRQTVPWLQVPGGQDQTQLVTKVRELALDGGIIFVDGPLFNELAHLNAARPEPMLLQGDATPVSQWGQRPIPYEFLNKAGSVSYDVSTAQTLVSVKAAMAEYPTNSERGKYFEPFLAVNNDWLASATRIYVKSASSRTEGEPKRGAVVFLPDRFGATQDSCAFLRGLVNMSLELIGSRPTDQAPVQRR
jgi:hypothetical protein